MLCSVSVCRVAEVATGAAGMGIAVLEYYSGMLVKYRVNSGQVLGQFWSSTGSTLVKCYSGNWVNSVQVLE